MKKLTSVVLSIVIAFFISCGKNNDPDPKPEETLFCNLISMEYNDVKETYTYDNDNKVIRVLYQYESGEVADCQYNWIDNKISSIDVTGQVFYDGELINFENLFKAEYKNNLISQYTQYIGDEKVAEIKFDYNSKNQLIEIVYDYLNGYPTTWQYRYDENGISVLIEAYLNGVLVIQETTDVKNPMDSPQREIAKMLPMSVFGGSPYVLSEAGEGSTVLLKTFNLDGELEDETQYTLTISKRTSNTLEMNYEGNNGENSPVIYTYENCD